MLRRTLNLGILAHVDAGKTTLTERLLYGAGVIDAVGSVDDGTTQTDTLALERQRGITIRSAVVSFAIGETTVNLIDTPGHPDFIAEVERVLSVLDGAVLVLSAVEGVQPQTRILMRALQRLRVPTLLFVNKIDRAGADDGRVLAAIAKRLTPAVVPMGRVRGLGTRGGTFTGWRPGEGGFATALAECDEAILAAYVDGDGVPYERLRARLAEGTRRARLHPVFFGSALTGAGVDTLADGIAELLPAATGDADGPVSGTVFKVERDPAGRRLAYVRMYSGTVHVRDRLASGRVTGVGVFADGALVRRESASAGEIGALAGLAHVRVGDAIGAPHRVPEHHFAPPTLETVVVPQQPADGSRLRVALEQLAEQDPLIGFRQEGAELSVSLYGEVQKEVIQATLAADYGLDVAFRETTTICVERPAGSGEAVEILNAETNPFNAELGLRVEPAAEGSGVAVALEVDARAAPLYVYKNLDRFGEAMDEYVRDALRSGLRGWRVVDCAVTVTRCDYPLADGPPSRRGPMATAADFRKLTPLVLHQALARAGTVVCEPMLRARIEVPAGDVGTVLAALGRLGAGVEPPSPGDGAVTVEALLPAARAHDLRRFLPSLTSGEGVLETSFAGYRPGSGEPRERP